MWILGLKGFTSLVLLCFERAVVCSHVKTLDMKTRKIIPELKYEY